MSSRAHAQHAGRHADRGRTRFGRPHVLPVCCEILSRTPVEKSVMVSAEPPKEMKGRGRPLVGSEPVTTPRFTRVWVASITVRPRARYDPKASGARRPMR